jgi:signal transduction histidine kinase
MHLLASGAAFIDRSGAVVAADSGFLAGLGLRPEDPTGTLRARAEAVPELRALLAGEGPDVVRVTGADGATVELERVPGGAGVLLVARSGDAVEWLEHSMRSHGLGRLAGGVAHDIKNPLNAMALQLALLGEKLSSSEDASAAAASHLGHLRDQIGRVNEIVRRLVDVAEPSAPLGYTDVGALLVDLGSLFAHEARRRRIELAVEAQPGTVGTSCDPARVGRIVLGVFARALAETPDGGRLAARAEARGPVAAIAVEHVAGASDPELRYYSEVAAAAAKALGGEFAQERRDGVERLSLALPRNERE